MYVELDDAERATYDAIRAATQSEIVALLRAGGAAWHLAGHLRLESWQGSERVQLLIDDAAPAGQGGPA